MPEGRSRPSRRPGPRWRRLPHARPLQVLHAARKVFAAHGLGGTVEAIAREAGVNVATLYRYFENKEAVFTAMLHDQIARIIADHERHVLNGQGRQARPMLRGIAARAYRLFQTSDYCALVQMIFGEASRYPRQAELFYREATLRVGLRVAELIQRGIDTGEFRRVDALIAARGFMGMLFSFAVCQRLLGGDRVRPFDPRQVVEVLTTIYLDGLGHKRARLGTRGPTVGRGHGKIRLHSKRLPSWEGRR